MTGLDLNGLIAPIKQWNTDVKTAVDDSIGTPDDLGLMMNAKLEVDKFGVKLQTLNSILSAVRDAGKAIAQKTG